MHQAEQNHCACLGLCLDHYLRSSGAYFLSLLFGQQPSSLGLWRLTYGRLECGAQVSMGAPCIISAADAKGVFAWTP